MTDPAHEDTHDNPAVVALQRAGAAGIGSWFGLGALVAATVVLLASIIRLLGDASPYTNGGGFSFADRISILGSQLTLLAPFLGIAAFLVDGPRGRHLARFAFAAWVVAVVLLAIADQRGLADIDL
ncbi:MAG: hypothetical protein JWM86_530 [Thermoleophilia bacterium]|nr:hypothetical protein [Thermoleophilia bacterium]